MTWRRKDYYSSIPTFKIALESAAVIDEDLRNLRESELGRVCCGCRAAGRGASPGFGLNKQTLMFYPLSR